MNWDAIGAIGEILGAAAVVASLFYVALQVRQNTKQSEINTAALDSSAEEAMTFAANDIRLRIAESDVLSTIYASGLSDPDSLSDVDLRRFQLVMSSLLQNTWLMLRQRERGISNNWHTVETTVARVMRMPGGKWFWENYGHEFEAELQDAIEIMLQDKTEPSNGS